MNTILRTTKKQIRLMLAFIIVAALAAVLVATQKPTDVKAATGTPVIIAAAGDINSGSSGSTDAKATGNIIRAINPSKVLTLGDNAYPDGTDANFASFEQAWGTDIKAKTLPSPGNHDYHTSGGAGYYRYFSVPEYYATDLGNGWRAYSLNCEIACGAGSAQDNWLVNDLAANPNTHKIWYLHRALYTSGANHGPQTMAQNLWNRMDAAKADINLAGHDHIYERMRTGEISNWVVGTGGAGNYTCGTPISTSKICNVSHGILRLALYTDSYAFEYRTTTGQTLDSGSFPTRAGGCTVNCNPGDTTPPAVAITGPANGITTSADPVAVSANALDASGIKQVEFFVNGASKSVDTTAPYGFNWSTTGLTTGAYTVKAVATDNASPANTSQTTITVNFVASSGCTVQIPPTSLGTATISVNIPSTGNYHAWSRIKATDTTNNSYIMQVDTSCPILVGDSAIPANTWTWVDYKDGNTGAKNDISLTTGAHSIKLIGREANVGVDRVLFLSDTCVPTGNGDNCLTPAPGAPTVSLTYPTAGRVLQGTETLTATATAGTGTTIANVEFFNGFTSLGKDTSAPYSYAWNTTTEPNGTYTVSAKATDALGQQSTLSQAQITITNTDNIAPSQPGNLRTTSVTSGEVKLAWDASTDNKGVTGYNVYLNDGTAPFATVTGTTFDDTHVSPNTNYVYHVEAFDAAANKSTRALLGVTTPNATDPTPPSVPTNVTATNSGSVAVPAVTVNWTASTDNVAVKDYLVRRDNIVIATVTTTTYNDTAVANGKTYSYAIVARDAAGNSSAASTTATVTIPPVNPGDIIKPSVPSSVSAIAPSYSQVNVSWIPSTDNVDVTGYHIFRNDKTAPIGTVNVGPVVAGITPIRLTFGDATVTAGTTYTYKVSAFDAAANESDQSTGATVTVPKQDSNATFSDNFTNGSGLWSPVSGAWSVAATADAHANVYHQDADKDAWSTAGSSSWSDYAVEANVKPESFIAGTAPTQFAAIYGRWQDNSHWYYVVLRSNGVIELKKNVGGVYTVLTSKQTTVTPGTWYKLKLNMQGTSLKVVLNGQEVLTATDSSISTGKIAVGSYYAKASFDDVTVSQSNAPVMNVFKPEADSFVSSQYPKQNFGSRANIAIDGNPLQSGLIRFTVKGTSNRFVTKAILALNVTDSSYAGGKFYSVPSSWTETGVTWENAPKLSNGSQLITQLANVQSGKQVQVDVTRLIRGDGTYTIRIDSDNKDVVKYGSRESTVSSTLWVSSQFLSL